MKRILIVLMLIPFMAMADSGFLIKGNVSGVKSGTVDILEVASFAGLIEGDVVQAEKVRIENGEFIFSGKLTRPASVLLKISTRSFWVFLENKTYSLSGNFPQLNGESLKGGTANDLWQVYLKGGSGIDKFIDAHKNSIVAAYLALLRSRDSYEAACGCFDLLGPEARNSVFGKSLQAELKSYEKRKPGRQFPDLSLTNVDGTKFDMGQMKGKIVVLDFWASWCGPCRMYIPKMKEYHKKFKDKGVEFVSVSVDEDLDRWRLAMEAENMPWKQVLAAGAFKAGQGIQEKLNIYNIPYVIVLDKDGKIEVSLDAYQKGSLESELDKLVK